MKMKTRLWRWVAWPLLALYSGCGSLDVQLLGTLHDTPELARLKFCEDGFPYVEGQRLFLPRGHEEIRYGLVVVDTDPLPPGWRAEHAPQGGILVSAVDKASPLAVAGLRSYDLVETINGKAAETVEDVIGGLEEEDQVELVVRRVGKVNHTVSPRDAEVGAELVTAPDNEPITISATAVDWVQGASVLGLPLIVEQRSSITGESFSLGPGGSLLTFRQVLLPSVRPEELLRGSGRRLRAEASYRDRSEWSFLFGLFRYQGETVLSTGETRRRLRLFWCINLGDDLEEGVVDDFIGTLDSAG